VPKSVNIKSQILDVSLKLFSEKSYHGASIRDIAKAIGKRESSIYNHFGSKEEILKEIIANFSNRNFGKIVLTDNLVNNIGKPNKFFLMLAENLIDFWNTEKERMFIKILIDSKSVGKLNLDYTLNTYLNDFRSLAEFIFGEMTRHKFINKFDPKVLSSEFISPIFLSHIEVLVGFNNETEHSRLLKSHVEFFWKAIKK